MRLGLNMLYSGARLDARVELVAEADRLGYHSVWVAEVYGSDAVTMLTWYAAHTKQIAVGSGILQMAARTPAMTAMTAATLDELTDGRFLLGLGVSGPQVVEGWHGVPYGKPLGRTREYLEIVRTAIAREGRLTHQGDHYRIPYDGQDATGLGRPLKLTIHPRRQVPIYLAAIGPKNIALTAEIADGWLPIFYSPTRAGEAFRPHLEEGFARSGDGGKPDRFDISASAPAIVTDDKEQARWGVKPTLALYIGGMGARGRNFYNDLAVRYGYPDEARAIQDLYLEGKKEEAIALVPDDLVDDVSLIGTRDEIRDRLDAWRESGVTTLQVFASDVTTMRTLAELVL